MHTFWPPPPFQFTLDLDHAERASMSARWHRIAEGKLVDVGDVVMVRGIRVQGRILDEAGQPVAKQAITVRPGTDQNTGNGVRPSTVWAAYGRSGTDGRFECKMLLPPGPFRVELQSDLRLTKPVSGTLSLERPIEELALVVTTEPIGPTIAGRVVDEGGQPIRSVRVEGRSENGRTWASAYSQRDGTFVVKPREATATDPIRLEARHDEFEPTKTEAAVAWGSTDLVLTMRRAGGITVHVHDEAKRPLTDFVVRVAPRASDRSSSDDYRVRTRGPYEAGFATVPGVPRGKWTVVVEFATKAERAHAFLPIEVHGNGTMRVDLHAPKNVARTLRLVDGAGAPVAGSKVQLATLGGDEFDASSTRLLGPEQYFGMAGRGRALLLAETVTDGAGTAALTGPPGQPLLLQLLGPGHVPTHRRDVRLEIADDLVVTVATGARLRGRVGPPEALAEMMRLGGQQYAEKISLRLTQGEGRQLVFHPTRHDDERFGVAADGRFDITGLPSGSWQLGVQYWQSVGSGGTTKLVPAGTVILTDGATTEFDPDAQSMLPGTLRAVVQQNGAVLANATLNLQGTVPATAGTPAAQDWAQAKTDAEGRFTAHLRPGIYRVHVQGPGRFGGGWECAESATIVVGQTTEQSFTVWTGTLRITVRDARGAVVPGLELQAVASADNQPVGLPATDAEGRIRAELATATLQFRVLQKRLQSQEARQQLWRELQAKGVPPSGDMFAPYLLDVGNATVVAGQEVAVELKLPVEWDQ